MKTYLLYKKENANNNSTNSIEHEGREYFFNGGIMSQLSDVLCKQEILQPFIFQGMNTNIVFYNSKSSILSFLSKEWILQLFTQLQLLQQQDQFCNYSLYVRGMIEWKQEIFDLNVTEREIIKFEPLTKPFLYNNKILLWDEEMIDKIWKPQLMQTKEELQTWLETLFILLSKQNITAPNLFLSFHISRIAKLDPTSIFGSNRFVLADLKDISQFWIKQDELQRNITNGASLCTILDDFFGGNALNHFVYMPTNELDGALLEKMQVLATTTVPMNPVSRRDVSNPLFTFIENRIFKTCRELISKETMFRDALYELKEKYNYITKTNIELKTQCDEKDELIFKFTNEIANYKKALRDLSVYENGDAIIKDRKLIELTDMYLKSCKDYEQLLIEYNALKKNLSAKKLATTTNENNSNLEYEKKIQELEQEISNSHTKHEQEIQQAKHQIENLKKELEVFTKADNKQESSSLDQMLKELEGKNLKQIEKELIQWKTKAIMANKQLETMQQYTTQLLKNK